MKLNETRNARTLALALSIGVGLLYQTTAAQAQSAMAPPVSAGAPASGSNVYQWADVPLNQQIPITRAVFDQGGYQLYASTGETIVVPFVNQNLYVMKFGQTSGGMYFVNDGTAPTLFVPPGGYLENAAASGAHWYPFPHDFHYVSPVYVGIAPTWDAYVGMGWYPGMAYYGGYWGYHPWHVGLAFSPFPGLYFSIGGHPYYGWNSYHSYYYGHPYGRIYERSYAPYHYFGVPHRGPAYFAGRPAFGHPSGYYASHGSFAHGGGAFGRAGVVHGGAFGHAAVSHGGAFGHAAVSHGGSFGRAATPGHAFGGAVNHSGGSFGHSGGAFGGGHPSGGSFGRSAPVGGHSAPFGGGGSHGSFGGGGGSHGSFGGGGASHGSFGGGGDHGGGGGSHGSFGGGGGSHGGGGGDHHR